MPVVYVQTLGVGIADGIGLAVECVVPYPRKVQRGGDSAFVVNEAGIRLVTMLLKLRPGISHSATDEIISVFMQYKINHSGIAFSSIPGTWTLNHLYSLYVGCRIGLQKL